MAVKNHSFDLVVVGGGPGGYVAAIRAAQLGMTVALVEREHLGGICLNWGCIPTKALLRSSEIHHLLHNLDAYGLSAKEIKFDIKKVVERSRGVATQLSGGIGHLLKKNKVTVFMGFGELAGNGQLNVKDKKAAVTDIIAAKHIILATGARARVLKGFEPDGKLIWSYKEAMVPEEMPKSVAVVGSGAIGSEFASFYNDMGAEVTLFEAMDRVLPVEDEEVSTFVHKSFSKQGITVKPKTKVLGVEKGTKDLTLSFEEGGKKQTAKFDRLIMAVGIVANVEGIGLEKTNVKTEKGHIVVNEYLKTAEPGVYAIGDCVPGPWLAHKASHEGIICVEKIAGEKDVHPLNHKNIPGCTYCRPQVASIGLTEAQAKKAGFKLKVGRFPYMANGKAIALGEPEGFVKTIFDEKTGELLGAHMVGAEVTELIQGFGVAKTLETTEAELMHTVFPHPTLSEMMHESVLDAYGKAIHF